MATQDFLFRFLVALITYFILPGVPYGHMIFRYNTASGEYYRIYTHYPYRSISLYVLIWRKTTVLYRLLLHAKKNNNKKRMANSKNHDVKYQLGYPCVKYQRGYPYIVFCMSNQFLFKISMNMWYFDIFRTPKY